jgi:hypothetical protein
VSSWETKNGDAYHGDQDEDEVAAASVQKAELSPRMPQHGRSDQTEKAAVSPRLADAELGASKLADLEAQAGKITHRGPLCAVSGVAVAPAMAAKENLGCEKACEQS